jgi:hypothetical protein
MSDLLAVNAAPGHRRTRTAAGFLLPCLISLFIPLFLWGNAEVEEIASTSAGVVLQEYVAPSWRNLAVKVRSGETSLTSTQQADRFEKFARFVELQAQSEATLARLRVQRAWLIFACAVVVVFFEFLVGGFLVFRATKRESHGEVPPGGPQLASSPEGRHAV